MTGQATPSQLWSKTGIPQKRGPLLVAYPYVRSTSECPSTDGIFLRSLHVQRDSSTRSLMY
jgi:hypothetical protein